MIFNQERPSTPGTQALGIGDLRRRLGGRGRAHNAMQSHFLLRLARLLTIRRTEAASLAADDWRVRLLNKATYCTYCDCVEAGVGDDARALFQQEIAERLP
jgi:hypothetical protein